ncbi:hypothetical protein GCM10027168_52830 [Streptomyces capparidis]
MEGEGTRNELGGGGEFNAPVILAGSIGRVEFAGAGAGGAADGGQGEDVWVRLVRDHHVWRLTRDPGDAFRGQALTAARRLAWLRDAAVGELRRGEDPWLDATLAARMLHHTSTLLRRRPADAPAEAFCPAEAVLLSLAPLLYQVCWNDAAARLAALVGPAAPGPAAGPAGPERRAFEHFAQRHPRLLRAAQLDLPGRPDAGKQIGWWLFHQWLAGLKDVRRPAALRAVADRVAGDDLPLVRRVLTGTPVTELLYGLRLDPVTLCRSDRPSAVGATVPLFGGFADAQERQTVRARLVGLLLAVARMQAVEIPDLPDTVVQHLGIPNSVDLALLRGTVEHAAWDEHAAGQVLRADCHHEAVLKALREHAGRVDALLHAVLRETAHDTTLKALEHLPPRASADSVRAAEVDGRPVFDGEGHRFRLDEQRVQELLMGEQLYQNRALAVRELYQNALDACRYRRARHEYLERTSGFGSAWRGRIRFVQGTDEHGRHYLECADNGVGMGEEELTGVFSQAGARFPELTEFLDGKADWDALDPPVRLHPNSRFGIGVLSYFMLADEIEVTTCRMGRRGRPGPLFRVAIVGPGHLFRIQRLREEGEPGTRVRLYLRDGDRAPSCLRELDRLLGIAEFRTEVEHDGRGAPQVWLPGRPRPRERPPWEEEGLSAAGAMVPCADSRVVWCERGGALLVDGLLVSGAPGNAGLSGPGDRGVLRGALIDLAQSERPPRLSVDRTVVLDDVSEDVEALVTAAAEELVADQPRALPTFGWLAQVTTDSPRLADIVTRAATASGLRLPLNGREYDMAVAGFMELDAELGAVDKPEAGEQAVSTRYGRLRGLAEHLLLWRVLANPGCAEFALLAEVVPELGDTRAVLPALPTDIALLDALLDEQRQIPSAVVGVAMATGYPPRAVALRARRLGVAGVVPERFPAQRPVSAVDLALLGTDTPELLPHLLHVHLRLGVGLNEAARRLRYYGLQAPVADTLPERPDDTDLKLLSRNLLGRESWYDGKEAVPPGHVSAAAAALGLSTGDVLRRLAVYGLHCPSPALPDPADTVGLRLVSVNLDGRPPWLLPLAPVPPAHLVLASRELSITLGDAAARLTAYGFPLPPVLPAEADEDDLALLSRDHDGVPPWLSPLDALFPHRVLAAAEALGTTPGRVTERLRAYGLAVVTLPAARLTPDAVEELGHLLPAWAHGTGIEEPMDLVELLIAAERTGLPPAELAGRLAALGLDVPEVRLPDGLPVEECLTLLSLDLDAKRPWLDSAAPVPLHHVLAVARHRRLPLEDAAALLRTLGLTVPHLPTAIRAALARVPLTEPS